jgi:RNA polymerase sigma-32 factor
MMANQTSQMPDDGLNQYLQRSRHFPMLSPEGESALAYAWRDQRDPKALEQLVGSHLRLAIKIARGFRGYGLPVSELISEGNVGLMQAAQKFDPDRGFRFSTYAIWWIRAAIQEYILHNCSLVKMGTTAAQKKLFFNLRKLKGEMEELEQGDLPPAAVQAIATKLDVSASEVVEMNRRLASGDSSLNRLVGEDGENEWQDLIADDRPNQEVMVMEADEFSHRHGLLGEALEQLNLRERRIIIERRLTEEPMTLEELSQEFSVSRERIRQIEVRAFEKLQRAMKEAVANQSHPRLAANQSQPRLQAVA